MSWKTVLLAIVAGLFVAWIAACSALFRRLATYHQDKYEQLGRPRLLQGRIKTNIAMTRFFYMREYRNLRDPHVTYIVRIMWFLLFSYIVIFFLLFRV